MPPVAIECVRNVRRALWGDKLIGLSIDLEELHSVSRALAARVDEARAGNQELQSYVQRLDSGLVDEDQEPPTS
jgi:hypothetical protein